MDKAYEITQKRPINLMIKETLARGFGMRLIVRNKSSI